MEQWREELYHSEFYQNELMHHGILGQKWGVRRYQNKDGSLTYKGKQRTIKDKVRNKKSFQKSVNKYEQKGYSKEDAEQLAYRKRKIANAIKVGTAVAVVAGSAYAAKKMSMKFKDLVQDKLTKEGEKKLEGYDKWAKDENNPFNKKIKELTEGLKDSRDPEYDKEYIQNLKDELDHYGRNRIIDKTARKKKGAAESLRETYWYSKYGIGDGKFRPESDHDLRNKIIKLKPETKEQIAKRLEEYERNRTRSYDYFG